MALNDRSQTRLLLLLASLFLISLVPGCDDERGARGSASAHPKSKPPVPAPDGLLAELVIPHPATLVADVRQAAGGPVLFLPRTVGGLVANLFGFPIRVAEQVDEHLPIVGAVAAGSPGDGGVADDQAALAIHVKDAARFIAQIGAGSDGRFTSQPDPNSELTWLTAKPEARTARLSASLAVLDNYLLIGNSQPALRRLGPYLSRTLASRKLPRGGVIVDLTPAVFGDALRHRLLTWQKVLLALPLPVQLRGLLDLEAAAGAAGAFLLDLGQGRVTVTLDQRALVVTATATARNEAATKRLAALPTVDTAEMLELPDDTLAAIGWAETPGGRVDAAKRRGPEIARLFGDDFGASERKTVAEALEALARGRADQSWMGLRCTGVGITGLATGGVQDAEALSEGLEALIELHKHPAVVAQLEARSLSIKAKKSRVLLVPHDIWKIRLTPLSPSVPKASPSGGEGPTSLRPISLAFGLSKQRFWATAGMETVETLQHLYRPDRDRSLATKHGLKDARERLGDQAWVAVLLDPQGMHGCLVGKPGGALVTPVAFAAGPGKAHAMELRLEIARPLLRVAVKELGGF